MKQLIPKATPRSYETITPKAGVESGVTVASLSTAIALSWEIGDTIILVCMTQTADMATVTVPGLAAGDIVHRVTVTGTYTTHIWSITDSPIDFNGNITFTRPTAGLLFCLGQVYSGVGAVINSTPVTATLANPSPGVPVTVSVPGSMILTTISTRGTFTATFTGARLGENYRVAFEARTYYLVLSDMVAPTAGTFQTSQPWILSSGSVGNASQVSIGLIPREVVPPVGITPGAGAISNTATTSISIPITLADDDTVILVCHTGSNTASSAQTALMNPTGPGNQTWEFLGQPSLLPAMPGGNPQLWVIRKAVAASGNITLGRQGGMYLISMAQIYKNVGQVIGTDISSVEESLKPAIGPFSTRSFNITVPGSVGVTAFSFVNYGSNQGVAFPGNRLQFLGAGQAIFLSDHTFAVAGPQQISQPWSNTSSAPTYRQLSVLLVPATVTPTPDFSLSVDEPNPSLDQGSSTQIAFAINPTGGFSSPVTFQVSGLPSGVTASWSSNPAYSSTVLTLTATSGAALGTANITITGTGGGVTFPVTVALTVNQGAPPEPMDPRLKRLATGLLLLKIPVEVPLQ